MRRLFANRDLTKEQWAPRFDRPVVEDMGLLADPSVQMATPGGEGGFISRSENAD